MLHHVVFLLELKNTVTTILLTHPFNKQISTSLKSCQKRHPLKPLPEDPITTGYIVCIIVCVKCILLSLKFRGVCCFNYSTVNLGTPAFNTHAVLIAL